MNELYKVADFTLEQLSKLGADGAEVQVSESRMDELNVDAGKFSLMRTTFNSNVSIRALVGGRKGTYSTNALDDESLADAAKTAVDAANSSEPDDAEIIAPSFGLHNFAGTVGTPDLDKLYDRIDEFMKTVAAEYPKVDILQLIASVNSPTMLYANSNGSQALQQFVWYELSVEFSGRDGEKTSSMSGYGFAAETLDTPFIEVAEMRRMLDEIQRQIDTVPVDGKFVGKLLVAPDCFSSFLQSIFGNCVSNGPLIAGDSPWKDKLGEIVADAALSVACDPLNPAMVCNSRVTSDGYLTDRQSVIANGRLDGFLLSQYAAAKTGKERAKCYGGALVVEPGDKTFDELLSGISEGLLINRFSGGEPSTNGDFSGIAKNSFLIKDGKVGVAVNETMISGNLLDMLQSVSGIGSELISDGSKLVPWIVFDGVTVSGK